VQLQQGLRFIWCNAIIIPFYNKDKYGFPGQINASQKIRDHSPNFFVCPVVFFNGRHEPGIAWFNSRFEKAAEVYLQPMSMVMDCFEKLNISESRQNLKDASEAFKENPGCEDLRNEVLHLQDDVLCLTADKDQVKRRYKDLSFEFIKARDLLRDTIERRSHAKDQYNSVSTESQGSGMCKQQMMHGFHAYINL
jgi:hypothetical protein